WSESYPVVLASLLPCFWIYAEVGKDIVDNSTPNNPYQAWVDTYSGEEFHTAVRNVIATVDRVAARVDADTLEKMDAAYTHAARLASLFWDSAFEQRQWPGLYLQDAHKKSCLRPKCQSVKNLTGIFFFKFM